jgi:hypothetical protein
MSFDIFPAVAGYRATTCPHADSGFAVLCLAQLCAPGVAHWTDGGAEGRIYPPPIAFDVQLTKAAGVAYNTIQFLP